MSKDEAKLSQDMEFHAAFSNELSDGWKRHIIEDWVPKVKALEATQTKGPSADALKELIKNIEYLGYFKRADFSHPWSYSDFIERLGHIYKNLAEIDAIAKAEREATSASS